MNVLIISGELAPICGDEPLGRIAAQQANALAAQGHRVTAIAPMRDPSVVDSLSLARRLSPMRVELSGDPVDVHVFDGRLPSGVEIKLLANDELFLDKPCHCASEEKDDPLRHAVLAKGALTLAQSEQTDWHVIHGFCVPGALACFLARQSSGAKARTVLSLETLTHQGRCDRSWVDRLGLGWEAFTPEGFEFFDDLCLLKAGLVAADRILFAGTADLLDARKESAGTGLEGVLRSRGTDALAVLPGLDYSRWNPATDAHLSERYDALQPRGKGSCKADLQNRLGLPVRSDVPLVAVLGPLTDLASPLAQALDRVLRSEVQLVAPRGMSRTLESLFDENVIRWPERLARVELDERSEHQLIAGADFVLLEAPRGADAQSLLACLRYGALPVVPGAGLARDLVVDLTGTFESGNGFVLQSPTPSELVSNLRRAIGAFSRPSTDGKRAIAQVVERAMKARHSTEDGARRLEEVYEELLTASAEESLEQDG